MAETESSRQWRERNPDYRKRYYAAHKKEHAARSRCWYERNRNRNPDAARARWRAAGKRWRAAHLTEVKYGLAQAEYERLMRSGCAICRTQLQPVLDHNHKTGKIRGVLCRRCNAGLGMFRDDPSLLSRAAVYLAGGIIRTELERDLVGTA